jgi:RNA polymerase primary sigma factor
VTHPYLTAEDERRLARQGRRGRAELVRCNQALVRKFAAKFVGCGVDFDDLFQEGAVGLAIAASRYDPGRGARFSTYAVHWVEQRLMTPFPHISGEISRRRGFQL